MHGHRIQESPTSHIYELSMKVTGEQLRMFGRGDLFDADVSLLRSITIVHPAAGFSKRAIAESKCLLNKDAVNARDCNMAFLKAVEGATNEDPTEGDLVYLLAVARRCHSPSGRAWFKIATAHFPADQPSLTKRFPEFIK
jgi:hypothetical protein